MQPVSRQRPNVCDAWTSAENSACAEGSKSQLPAIVGAGDDLALAHHDGADGYLPLLGRQARLLQGKAHEALVIMTQVIHGPHLLVRLVRFGNVF